MGETPIVDTFRQLVGSQAFHPKYRLLIVQAEGERVPQQLQYGMS